MTYKKLSPLLSVALAGLALSVISLGVWLKVNKANDNLYFGVVEHKTEHSFSMNDAFNGQVTVNITEHTALFRGKETTQEAELTDGRFVQVVGVQLIPGTVTAESIRIMKSPKE